MLKNVVPNVNIAFHMCFTTKFLTLNAPCKLTREIREFV